MECVLSRNSHKNIPIHNQLQTSIKGPVRVFLHLAQDADVQPISSDEESGDGNEALADTLANLVLGIKETHGRT